MAGKVTGLHHIGVKVRDAETSARFYEQLLDFERFEEFRHGASHLVFLRAGSCVLELIEKPEIERLPAGNVDHVALAVENIEEIVGRLQARRVDFVSEQIAKVDWLFGGTKNIFFMGPDGERIELFEVVGKGE